MIVFLNGASSSGKTRIARTLQSLLPGVVCTGVDAAMAKLPARYHNHPDGFSFRRRDDGSVTIEVGPIGRQALLKHQAATAELATGADVVADEVIWTDWLREGWLAALAGHRVLWVGVNCELAELERRERARGDRELGQARGLVDVVHRGMTYDLQLDSTHTPAEVLAGVIVERLQG